MLRAPRIAIGRWTKSMSPLDRHFTSGTDEGHGVVERVLMSVRHGIDIGSDRSLERANEELGTQNSDPDQIITTYRPHVPFLRRLPLRSHHQALRPTTPTVTTPTPTPTHPSCDEEDPHHAPGSRSPAVSFLDTHGPDPASIKPPFSSPEDDDDPAEVRGVWVWVWDSQRRVRGSHIRTGVRVWVSQIIKGYSWLGFTYPPVRTWSWATSPPAPRPRSTWNQG